MELLLNQEIETGPEPIEVTHFTNHGILNSNYKSLVRENFSASASKSIFAIKRGLRASQLNMVNHTEAILKVTLFTILLIAIF